MNIFMQLMSPIFLAPFRKLSVGNASLLTEKKDWIQWLTKAAAAIIISSLQGAVLVTGFYDIMTSAASSQVFKCPSKLWSLIHHIFRLQQFW